MAGTFGDSSSAKHVQDLRYYLRLTVPVRMILNH